jgi:hypothetical protein
MAQNEIRGSTQIKDQTIPYIKHEPTTFASGGSIFTDKEEHSTECNGALQDFVLSHEAFHGSEHVFLRGTLRREGPAVSGGEYTVSVVMVGPDPRTQVHFHTAPETGDDLIVSYRNKYGT